MVPIFSIRAVRDTIARIFVFLRRSYRIQRRKQRGPSEANRRRIGEARPNDKNSLRLCVSALNLDRTNGWPEGRNAEAQRRRGAERGDRRLFPSAKFQASPLSCGSAAPGNPWSIPRPFFDHCHEGLMVIHYRFPLSDSFAGAVPRKR